MKKKMFHKNQAPGFFFSFFGLKFDARFAQECSYTLNTDRITIVAFK